MRSERSRACDISPKVREEVLDRDSHRCIICGTGYNLQMAHLLPRSLGGLGIPENLVTMCVGCHTKSHNESRWIDERAREYLMGIYPDFPNTKRRYKKYDWE